MRKLFVSTACVSKHYASLGLLLKALNDEGIHDIELGYSPPIENLRIPEDLPSAPASFLIHNYFPKPARDFIINLAAAEEKERIQSLEFCENSIRLSAKIKAPFYSVHCGFLAAFRPHSLGHQLEYDNVTPYETGYALFVQSLKRLLAFSQSQGVRLLIEPNVVAPFNLVDGKNKLLMMAEPAELRRLLGDFENTGLGVLLDLGHLRVTSETLHFDRMDFIDAVSTRVGAFHLHDNDGRTDQHKPVNSDSWTLDILRRQEFGALPVIIEAKFSNVRDLADHYCWLDKTLDYEPNSGR